MWIDWPTNLAMLPIIGTSLRRSGLCPSEILDRSRRKVDGKSTAASGL
jgi:hypothetical protein